jgi:cell division protein FtsB
LSLALHDRSWNTSAQRFRVAALHPANFTPVKKLLDRIPQRLRNRYGLATAALVLWIALFSDNDIWTTWKNHRELGRMEAQNAWYAAEIEKARTQLNELNSDKLHLEKFARERYLMKRENEDIFVLVAEKD